MRLRHAIPATLLLASTCRVSAATLDTAAAPAEPLAEVVVALTLNGASAPVALIMRRDTDGTLLLRAADFAMLRLRTPTRGGVRVNGEHYYRLGAELGAVVHFDVATQSVELQLPPAAFLDTYRSGSSADAPRVDRRGLGGFRHR